MTGDSPETIMRLAAHHSVGFCIAQPRGASCPLTRIHDSTRPGGSIYACSDSGGLAISRALKSSDMVKYFDEIFPSLGEWIEKQHMFTVATAPLASDGHVNVSAKGLAGTFHIEGPNKVWYEDLTGSGSETIAHVRENGRITIYFNAFEGPPRICRLWGRGTVHEYGTPEYDSYLPPGKRAPGSRAVIVVDVYKVGTSCGYAVPFYEFVGHRDTLLNSHMTKEKRDVETDGQEGLRAYWRENNSKSLDGLPGLQSAYLCDKPRGMDADYSRFGVVDIRKTRAHPRKQVSREEMKLMSLAFLFGAIVSAFVARMVGPC
ncbi:hypothetical protein OE88DRAFT_1665137 [Heliocybe sulcata]|uniref:Pyridoxamine 5'-phosphate oxidase N-terminal domain-containing protein n=1 Tax=Heliocybe sulcata TaxID=5364 RepID=A0A5C3MWA5_9AGAM|nr:hypothetical protein OE88DRAFT_1665137 [Heliocybe sulcata]